jgi:prepilin-type N-terminal cleavage/methylation domain-containing protein
MDMKDQRGFSLMELIVVMVILTIAILPLALVQTRSNRSVFDSGQYTEAVQVAQMQMEAAKSHGFAGAAPDSGMVNTFQWRTRVNNVSFGLNRVEVTVRWQEKERQRQVVITDLLSYR